LSLKLLALSGGEWRKNAKAKRTGRATPPPKQGSFLLQVKNADSAIHQSGPKHLSVLNATEQSNKQAGNSTLKISR